MTAKIVFQNRNLIRVGIGGDHIQIAITVDVRDINEMWGVTGRLREHVQKRAVAGVAENGYVVRNNVGYRQIDIAVAVAWN